LSGHTTKTTSLLPDAVSDSSPFIHWECSCAPKKVRLIADLRELITRLQSKGDYYIDPLLIEKALRAAGESARQG
jgi:hypothetical protein